MLNAWMSEWITTHQAQYRAQWGCEQRKHMTPTPQKTMSDCGDKIHTGD